MQGSPPEIDVELDGLPPADMSRDRELLRIAQEALQNALKHACATRIVLRLGTGDGRVILMVEDDGAGFDPQARGVRSRRLGLSSMEERARRLGGSLGDRVGRRHGHDGSAWRRRLPDAIRVLVVDDHEVVREGLRTFLRLQEGIDVIGEAGDGVEAVAEARRLAPDVVLMDLEMPRLDGVGAMQQIREARSSTRVIVLTSFGDDEKLLPAVRAGAVRLPAQVGPAAGGRARDPGSTRRRRGHRPEGRRPPARSARPARRPRRSQLTPRERDVLACVCRGMSNKAIARELDLAEKTVKTHVGHILSKLGVTDRTQAALLAVREGLADC